MNTSLKHREQDIAETRDRLHDTLDRIQDRLTVSGIVDEVLGSANVPRFDSAYANALGIVRRNPIPVLIVAGALGWALNRLGRREAEARARLLESNALEVGTVNDGRARLYDPDLPTGRVPSTPIDGRQGGADAKA